LASTRKPDSVKLVVAMLSCSQPLFEAAKQRLSEEFGPVDIESDVIPFDFTDYYDEEMGRGLLRQFLSFEKLIDPGEIAAIKVRTNALEEQWAATAGLGVKRPINLDPGYVSQSKLVLATTKDYSHRVYLAQGIYAEVTLRYQKGHFTAWPWTYPDYQTPAYIAFFARVRKRYLEQRGAEGRPP